MIANALKTLIQNALLTLGVQTDTDVSLEHPAEEVNGDYSSNIAMVLFPQVKDKYQSPRALAEAICSRLEKSADIERVEVAGPGFINFYLSPNYYLNTLREILKTPNYGANKAFDGQKIVVEYTDPNPFKEFHIGHLYSNIVGESIARLLEKAGATVWRADYFGDVGMHVAKSIWGLQKKIQQDAKTLSDLAHQPLKDRVNYLGQAYALGATVYEEDPLIKPEIEKLNKLIYIVAQKRWQNEKGIQPRVDYIKSDIIDEQVLSEIYQQYTEGRGWSLEYFEGIYQRLGTKFDGYYPESLAAEYGYELVMEGLEKGVFEKSDGAIIFPGEKYNLHTRVFINKLGLPTYEAKELGLAPWKQQDFPYDRSIIVTANEINEYFKVLIEAMKQLRPELGSKTQHIGHGIVKLPGGKMSSRTGKIKTGESLLEQANQQAYELLKNSNFPEGERLNKAEEVGQAAIKYALLKSNIGKDVVFDFAESVNFNGNSGPYLQYTHARACSVISGQHIHSPETYKPNAEELSLLRQLLRLPETTEQAAISQSPHLVCNYLYELAQRFNTFYNQHSILGSEDKPVEETVRQFRLAATAATAQVLKNGLNLLGIAAPTKM